MIVGMIRPCPRLDYRLLLICLLPVAALPTAYADENDGFNVHGGVNMVHDNNLFRVPEGNAQGRQSDTITNTVVGVGFDRRYSLQRFIANVDLANIHYASHDYLNANTVNYDGKWLWAVGSDLTGELSASRNEAPNSYADIPEIRNSGQRNLRVAQTQRFGIEYAAQPSWHVIGDIAHQTSKNEQIIFATGDTETVGAGLGIKYTPASGNWLSWQARQYQGKYTNRPFDPAPNSLFDNKFTQPGHEFNLNWQLTGHSTIAGRLEYLHRKHEHFQARDFSGWDGQLSYIYQYSGKTMFSVGYARGLVAYQSADSSYYVSDGINLGSQWAATDKITVGAHLGYSHRRYRGEIVPLATARRQDDGTDGGVDVTYKATRWLEIKAGVMAERRSSNLSAYDYSDRRFLLSANAVF